MSNTRRTVEDRLIEATWLLAAATVPLIFGGRNLFSNFAEPKQYIVHGAAVLMLIFWAVEASRRLPRAENTWAHGSVMRTVLFLTGTAAVWAVISALLSSSPTLSMFGRDANNTGAEAYSVAALAVVTAFVATRLKTAPQLGRLLLTITAAGTLAALYGIAQRFGWDGFSAVAAPNPAHSSFGNPIYFGSYLVLSIGAGLTLGLMLATKHHRPSNAWQSVGISLLVAVQVAGIWSAASRGPWVGLFMLGAAFLTAVAWLVPYLKPKGRRLFRPLAWAILTAIFCLAVFGSVSAVQGAVRGNDEAAAITAARQTAVVGGIDKDTGDPIPQPPTTTSARLGIWHGAATSVFDKGLSVGSLTGVGPGLSYYYIAQSAPAQYELVVYADVHSRWLQTLLELGWVGLVLSLGTILLLLYAGAVLVSYTRRRHRRARWHLRAVVLASLMATLIGYWTEQSFGLQRPADMLAAALLLGAVIAVGHRLELNAERVHTFKPAHPPARVMHPVIALVVAGALLYSFYSTDITQARASRLASIALDAARIGQVAEAQAQLTRASRLVPWSEQYALAIHDLAALRAGLAQDAPTRSTLFAESRAAVLQFEEWDRRSYRINITTVRDIAAGRTELTAFGSPDGHTGAELLAFRTEFLNRLRYLRKAMPAYPMVQALVAHGFIITGSYQEAIDAAELAIQNEHAGQHNEQAYWALAEGQRHLGRNAEAIAAYKKVLVKAPELDDTFHISAVEELAKLGQ
jgi:hypothetical protein